MAEYKDPYLEKLLSVQNEVKGINLRINALEREHALDADLVDSFLKNNMPSNPASVDLFLTQSEILSVYNRYELSLNKGVDCDALDYALSAACGVISGLIDILLVKTPHDGAIGKSTDKLFDDVVIRFAKHCGWTPKEGNEHNIASAIGFFERNAIVGYDQTTSEQIGNRIRRLSTKNHHSKSAGHYPDIIGLIGSICNQFTNTSTFFDSNKGRIVIVPGTAGGHELQGTSFMSKIVAGFTNWLWHCMSDIAGSSGSRGNNGVGMGLPIPFTEFFQFCNFGRFPNEKGQYQNFATVMTQVYEQQYDLRHAVAMSVPVAINDLLISMLYVIRRHFTYELSWTDSIPQKDNPELQRMMTVGVGSLCLVDLGEAAITSWGNWVQFFTHLNLVAWARFGVQGVHELQTMAHREINNMDSIQNNISEEWDRLLKASQDLLK